MRNELKPDISIEDASALFIAMSWKAVLLTGEKTLREHANGHSVEVHG
jgi:hypothetical protein